MNFLKVHSFCSCQLVMFVSKNWHVNNVSANETENKQAFYRSRMQWSIYLPIMYSSLVYFFPVTCRITIHTSRNGVEFIMIYFMYVFCELCSILFR